jgi:RNA polymerase sigma-70 factor (sigma-E family)
VDGRDAFEAFARREHPRLVGALTLYCGDPGVAEELAQDTLVRVRERWTRVSAAERPGAYAHRIAINLANSRFRRRSAERRALARLAGIAPPPGSEDPSARSDGEAVRAAVAALPPRQREVVVRRYFLDESVADVAAATGITEGSVKSATHRALASLRDGLGVELGEREEARDGA